MRTWSEEVNSPGVKETSHYTVTIATRLDAAAEEFRTNNL